MKMKYLLGIFLAGLFVTTTNAYGSSFKYDGSSALDIDTKGKKEVTLNINNSGIISDLNVALNLSGCKCEGKLYWGEIDVFLNHDSTSVRLLPEAFYSPTRKGGFYNALLDDEALNSQPYQGDVLGTFKPAESLSAFDNQSLGGLWSLSFQDNIWFDGDKLASWSLQGSLKDIGSTPGGPVNPVPEPATLLLFGTGLAGLLGVRRKVNQ